jgi:hypothetical protein
MKKEAKKQETDTRYWLMPMASLSPVIKLITRDIIFMVFLKRISTLLNGINNTWFCGTVFITGNYQ